MKPKKRVVTSYKNLSEELLKAFKESYPTGVQDRMIRIEKSPGNFFYGVILDFEQTSYLIKLDVEIDDILEEDEEEKDYYSDDIKDVTDELSDNDQPE